MAVASAVTRGGSTAPEVASTIGFRQVVAEGAAAWGRFASSGDLAELTPFFDPDGPQYGQFESERSLAGRQDPYEVVVDVLGTRRTGSWAVVEAKVTFVGTSESSREFQWRFALRGGAQGWRIWTVEEIGQSSVPSSSP